MARLGSRTGLFDSIPRLIRKIAVPKGMLIPGTETGNRKGAVSIMQDMKSPFSPIMLRKPSNVMPSTGIVEEISLMTCEKCSALSNLSDNTNTPVMSCFFCMENISFFYIQ